MGLKGPRPLHLLTLRYHSVGEDWEALLSVGNQNGTRQQETDSVRTSLCDLWADTGRGWINSESPGLLRWWGPLSARAMLTTHTGEASVATHIPPRISVMSAVSSEACLLTDSGAGPPGSSLTPVPSHLV